jgi:membrane-associated phospholipid phosphatase
MQISLSLWRLGTFGVIILSLSFMVSAKSRWERWIIPSDPVKDIIDLHKKLFTSWSTYKTVVAFFPPFILARMFDEEIQNNFYCKKHHKNTHQLPHVCHNIARWGLTIPMAFFASSALFAQDVDLRITSWVFLLGMPFVILGKDIFKSIDVNCNLRPWNEHFSCEKRSPGGFPSGHMAELTYMTILYGKRYGRLCAAPLAGYTAFLALSFVNRNRHYFSQIVGGAALGTVYALAADKLINAKLSNDFSLNFAIDTCGTPALRFAYQF